MSYAKNKVENYSNLGGINTKVSQYVNAPTEFRDLSNVNFVSPGALSKRPGTSLYIGTTLSTSISGGTEFQKLSGASYIVVTSGGTAYTATPSGLSAFKSSLQSGALFNFTTFVDRLFCADGTDYFKFDGSNTTNYSLPPGITGAWGITQAIGGGLSGTYVAGYGYLNDRGYLGPPSNGITISLNGATYGSITYYGLTQLTGYGVTAIQLWRSSATSPALFGTTFLASGSTTGTDTGFPLTTQAAQYNLWFTLAPTYLEIFNNQLFMAGFSTLPSQVYWSQIGEPEGVDPTFFNEFRTNDGDLITGMKAYQGMLIVTKKRSFHAVLGTDPTNFNFQQISDQYGNLSHRAMVAFENKLWFLDPRGIVEFNGAFPQVISTRIEPIMRTMNVDAALNNACATHHKNLNEVWFSFPTNGATMNNIIVAYDYVANAWTHYDGINPAVLFPARGAVDQLTIFYGSYSGSVAYFHPSLMFDQGNAITCMIQSRFLADFGETITKQYRRFYADVVSVTNGSSQIINVNFMQDYGTSTVLSATLAQANFQTRLDFGIPAKAIQFQMMHSSASLSFRLNGFTFESRFQRNV